MNEVIKKADLIDELVKMVESRPSLTQPEIIYCKDCKFFTKYKEDDKTRVENADGRCYLRVVNSNDKQFWAVKRNDFCSLAKTEEII